MRRALLPLATLVFCTLGGIAAAQTPPTVPNVADAARYAFYSVTSPTTNFDIPFPLYGDCTDVMVKVAGVTQTSGYTCISKSGAAIGNIAQPVTDAQVQFATAIGLGTVEVIGSRHPRFVMGSAPGITRPEFNRTLGTIISAQREIYDHLGIGNEIRVGFGVPTSAIGASGDYYIDLGTSFVYGPKTTTWPGTPAATYAPSPLSTITASQLTTPISALTQCNFTAPGSSTTRDCATKMGELSRSVTDDGVVMNDIVVGDAAATLAKAVANTTKFQNTLSYVSAHGGGRVTIPSGNLILCQVNLPDNVWVQGTAPGGIGGASRAFGGTNLAQCSTTNNLFVASNPTGSITNVRISDLSIYATPNSAGIINSVPQTAGAAIWFFNCDTCHVDHVVFDSQYVAVHEDGSFATGGAGATVWSLLDHLSIGNNQFIGLDLITASDAHVNDVLMRAQINGPSVAGIRIQSTGGIWINNTDIVGTGIGTWLAPNAGQTVKWLFIQNSALGDSNTQNNGIAFFINPIGAGAIVSDIFATNIWTSSSKVGGTTFACGSGGTVDSVELANVMAVGNGGPGIDMQCGTNIKVLGGIMEGNSNPGLGGTAGAAPGIRVAANLTDFTIRDINCKRQAGDSVALMNYCVQVLAGSSDRYRIGNINTTASATTIGNLIDGGTGTNKTVQAGINTDIAQLPSLNIGTCSFTQYTPGTGFACATGPGGGTVTSVGLALPGIFSVSGSPVTTTGTLAATLANQSPNLVLAGPSSGGAAGPTFRSLVGADLPNPSASTLGGVQSLAPTTNNFVTGIGTNGAVSAAQPTFANLGGSLAIIQHAAQAANTTIGNATSGSAVPTALAMPSCSLTANALQWLSGTGFQCISHVSSVALSLPSIFTVSGSPVTTSGTLSATLNSQNQNLVLAGPTTGAASTPTFRALVGADLPNPAASTLGGVQSFATVSHNFLTGVSTSGAFSSAQPAAADITGLAASATSDTTNAANITSGTLPAARLPNPSATTLGGIQSAAAVSNNFVDSISLLGVPHLSQPGFSNLSGSLALTQHASQTANTTIGNGTSGAAVPTALAMPSCSAAGNALQWTSGTGFACNSSITAASAPASGITGTLAVANGGTNYTGGAFSTFTPVITCSSGTITTASGAFRYLQIGKIVFFSVLIIDTTNGTCGGGVIVTLPVTANASINQVPVGRENGLTGKMLQGIINNTTMTIQFYDVTFPGANGAQFILSGTYEAA